MRDRIAHYPEPNRWRKVVCIFFPIVELVERIALLHGCDGIPRKTPTVNYRRDRARWRQKLAEQGELFRPVRFGIVENRDAQLVTAGDEDDPLDPGIVRDEPFPAIAIAHFEPFELAEATEERRNTLPVKATRPGRSPGYAAPCRGR